MFEFDNTRGLTGERTALRKVLAKARRLDEGNGDDGGQGGDADMEAFLMDYSIKLMSCIPDQVLTDADYNDHFGVVVFRLCPANKCSDDKGCSSGYADFAVDIGTYVDAFLEDQADNMNWDDNFDGGDFGSCTQFDGQNDDAAYYVGPGCTEDGTGLRMALYEDQYCQYESQTSFETVSNGWSLPYSSGGLVSTECLACTEDDGQMREMCLDLYEYSPFRCEAEFDFQHYYYDTNFEMYKYGQDTTGCNRIKNYMRPRSAFSSDVVWTDAILAVMLLVVTAAGYAWYSQWWEKRKYQEKAILFYWFFTCFNFLTYNRFDFSYSEKENLEKIDDDEDSQEDYHLDDDDDDGDYVAPSEVNDSAVNESGVSAKSNFSAADGELT